MTWRRAMERDAVAVAFPAWEWREDDVVRLEQEYDDGYDPTYNSADPRYITYVEVRRAGVSDLAAPPDRDWTSYEGQAAAEFWTELMARGTDHADAEEDQ